MPRPGHPRLNHVAMSMPADALGEQGRHDIVDFYSEVFGWQELPTETLDRKRLVLMVYRYDQFIFLIAEDGPMQCPRMDHFGFAVGSMDELQGVQRRAEAFRAEDDRVDLIDVHADDQQVVKIHSLYVGYLLPMMCEIQWWEFAA